MQCRMQMGHFMAFPARDHSLNNLAHRCTRNSRSTNRDLSTNDGKVSRMRGSTSSRKYANRANQCFCPFVSAPFSSFLPPKCFVSSNALEVANPKLANSCFVALYIMRNFEVSFCGAMSGIFELNRSLLLL